MNVPEMLRNYRVYEDGYDFIGTSDVELPTLEALTETIKGAGIAGEIAAPVIGHLGSAETKLNWRTVTNRNISLAAPKAHTLDIRGDEQVYDSTAGEFKTCAVKLLVVGIPKNTGLGKLEPATTTGTSNTLETNYMKLTIDGKDKLEFDKYNYIFKVDGKDYLSESREALGLA
ncbi:MAG: phage major tail tube protein [Acidaminococcaceae bacterium]|nr:phage major tail tube protein [Acidaminococcaceae bacterium]MBR1494879.1 phage major tail tube protein [Acidaminococcaceae bacterium]